MKKKTNQKEQIKIVKKPTGFTLKEVAIIVIITAIVGTLNGSIMTAFAIKDEKNNPSESQAYTDSELKEFAKTYEAIKSNFYKEVDSQSLIDGAIDGMVKKLNDPHSSYFTKDELKNFSAQLSGDYQGIGAGIGIKEDGTVYITKIFSDSPAYKAGLHPADIIQKVNQQDTTGKSTKEVSDMIKGEQGTTVTIEVKRKEQTLTFEIKRDTVELDSVYHKVIDQNKKKIGYIFIESFAQNTASQFEKALKEIEKQKVDSIIIDVRSDPGGYLHIVQAMAEQIIPNGKTIYQIKQKDKISKYESTGDSKIKTPIFVLINENSASAAEILTLALKESYGATVIGKTSYGKGTVQEVHNLTSGGMVKYTTKEWLSPNGNSINEKGIQPDIEVEITDINDDTQLNRAIEEATK